MMGYQLIVRSAVIAKSPTQISAVAVAAVADDSFPYTMGRFWVSIRPRPQANGA
jgi:hypothetical protein